MPGLCSVHQHTHRDEVDAALIRGRSYRSLEKRYGLARSSLARHKRDHLAAELALGRRCASRTSTLASATSRRTRTGC
jgi:hypothetical protein